MLQAAYMQRKDPFTKSFWLRSRPTEGYVAGFNSNIIKEVVNQRDNSYAGKQVDVFTIGKKGNDILSKDFSVAENRGDVFDELTFANVATVADQLNGTLRQRRL